MEAVLSEPPARENPTDSFAGNWRYHDRDFAKGGLKAKFNDNLEAIRTLKAIQAEGRTSATPEEQAKMAKFVGWGQLKAVVLDYYADNTDPDEKAELKKTLTPEEYEARFDFDKWEKDRARLKSLLTPEEWKSAQRSTMNAHYTHPDVVDAHWKIAEKLGYKGGKYLETSAGIGYYLGMMPEHLAGKSRTSAVEIDSLTGNMLKLLYPKVNVEVKGFQDHQAPPDFYDLVASNVPFGTHKVFDALDKKNNRFDANIHDYFFLKSADKVRPGGLVMHITSTGTLDNPTKNSHEIRKELAKTCDLVSAIRFPGGAHKENAGTEVVTDMLILRKRLPGEKVAHEGEVPAEAQPPKIPNNVVSNPDLLPILKAMVADDRTKALDLFEKHVKAKKLSDEERRQLAADLKEAKKTGLGFTGTTQDSQGNKYHWQDGDRVPEWLSVTTIPDPDGGDPIPINKYFATHPEQVLGRIDRTGTMYQGESMNVSLASPEELSERLGRRVKVEVDDRTGKRNFVYANGERVTVAELRQAGGELYKKRLADAIERMPSNIMSSNKAPKNRFAPDVQAAPGDVKDGGFAIQGGKVYIRDGGSLVEQTGHSKEMVSRIQDHLNLRDAIRATVNDQRAGEDATASRLHLNRVYDAFVSKWGILHDKKNKKCFGTDPDRYNVLALEKYNAETGAAAKMDIFHKDTVRSEVAATSAANATDALGISLHETGGVDVDHMAKLLKVHPDAVGAELLEKGLAYQDPSAGWQQADHYLSGNVRQKLVMARAAAAADPKYQANVAALEKVQPADVDYEDVEVKLGAGWVPSKDIGGFAAELLGARPDHFEVNYIPQLGQWKADFTRAGFSTARSSSATTIWGVTSNGSVRASFDTILEAALNSQLVTVYDKQADDTRVVNQELTDEANAKVQGMKDAFKEWVWTDDERRQRLHRFYNDNFNNIRQLKYNGSHLTFPGLNPNFTPHTHIPNFVWQVITTGTGLAAHEVGTGKAVPLYERILTPEGYVKMGDIHVGSVVCAGDGSPTTVIGVFPQGERNIFKIEMMNGDAVECDSEHLWLTQHGVISFESMYRCFHEGTVFWLPKLLQYGELTTWIWHPIKDITPSGRTLTQCIKVDHPSELFVMSHGIITHNTTAQIMSAMELRRLGLAKKPMIACLKSNIEQMVREAVEKYPGAKILSTVDMFDKNKRKQTIARIATGDYDMVFITHDQLDMLKMKPEAVEKYINEEIAELEEAVKARQKDLGGKSDKHDRVTTALEKAKSNLEAKLKKAIEGSKKDDAVFWEDLGCDMLFVDEAHMYKSLPVTTKLDRVKGIPTSRSDRATNMQMRVRWLQEHNGGRGVVFATGTPIGNTMAELYNMQKYLQPQELKDRGIAAFDAWANTFGEIQTKTESTASGERRPVSRFREFANIQELMGITRQFMDVQQADEIRKPNGDKVISRPKRTDSVQKAPATERSKDFMLSLVARAKAIKLSGRKAMEKGADNMLKLCSDGRKGSLDMRLIDPNALDDPASKVNLAIRNVLDISKKNPGKTQMIFCDLGVNPSKYGAAAEAEEEKAREKAEKAQAEGVEPEDDGTEESIGGSGFHLYKDILDKLVKGGIPRDKIADFSKLKGAKKEEAQAAMKRGDILVGLGSTKKMGTGVNVQEELLALHHLDTPQGYTPAEVEQRNGRAWRHGNKNMDTGIQIHTYVTEGSFDELTWGIISRKEHFIKQLLSGKSKQRRLVDEDAEEIDSEQIAAIASGDPNKIEKVQVDDDVKQLQNAHKRHEREQYKFKDEVKLNEAKVKALHGRLQEAKDTADKLATLSPDFSLTVDGKTYDKRTDATKAFEDKIASRGEHHYNNPNQFVANYRGLGVYNHYGFYGLRDQNQNVLLMFDPSLGSLESAVRRHAGKIPEIEKDIRATLEDNERVKANIGKPFPKVQELAERVKRQQELEAYMHEQGKAKEPDEEAKVAALSLAYLIARAAAPELFP